VTLRPCSRNMAAHDSGSKIALYRPRGALLCRCSPCDTKTRETRRCSPRRPRSARRHAMAREPVRAGHPAPAGRRRVSGGRGPARRLPGPAPRRPDRAVAARAAVQGRRPAVRDSGAHGARVHGVLLLDQHRRAGAPRPSSSELLDAGGHVTALGAAGQRAVGLPRIETTRSSCAPTSKISKCARS
jgi:hypothetical protein